MLGPQDRGGELAHRGFREVDLQRLQLVPDRTKLARRKHVLLEGFCPLGEVDRHRGGRRLLVLRGAIVRENDSGCGLPCNLCHDTSASRSWASVNKVIAGRNPALTWTALISNAERFSVEEEVPGVKRRGAGLF